MTATPPANDPVALRAEAARLRRQAEDLVAGAGRLEEHGEALPQLLEPVIEVVQSQVVLRGPVVERMSNQLQPAWEGLAYARARLFDQAGELRSLAGRRQIEAAELEVRALVLEGGAPLGGSMG